MNFLCDVLPSEIILQGINLKSFGINEYAWDISNIKTILEILDKENIAVLGGDIYIIEDNKVGMTFDSWYINNDGSNEFTYISNKYALEYILNYEKLNTGKYVYSLTI